MMDAHNIKTLIGSLPERDRLYVLELLSRLEFDLGEIARIIVERQPTVSTPLAMTARTQEQSGIRYKRWL